MCYPDIVVLIIYAQSVCARCCLCAYTWLRACMCKHTVADHTIP